MQQPLPPCTRSGSGCLGQRAGRSATHSASPGDPCAGSAPSLWQRLAVVSNATRCWAFANGLNRQPRRPGDQTAADPGESARQPPETFDAGPKVPGRSQRDAGVGFLADLALLLRDIFATPAAEAGEMTVDLTVCDGRVVWRGGGRGQNSKIWPQRFCLLGCSEEISIHVFTWHSTGTFLLQPRTRSLIFRNSLKVTSAYNSHSSEKEKTSAFPTRFQPILGRSEAQKPTYGKLSDKSELYP